MLWENQPGAQARKNLRQALWQLQAAIHAKCLETQTFIEVDADWVTLAIPSDLTYDVALFEKACCQVEDLPGEQIESELARQLEQAATLYRGDLLQGCYEGWCLFERERLQNMYLLLLDKLMGYCEVHTECEKGLAYANNILRINRAHERTHWRMMRFYYLAGDRTSALLQYNRCLEALREELGVEPGKELKKLAQRIQQDQALGPVSAPQADHGLSTAQSQAILHSLEAYCGTLGAAHEQLNSQLENLRSLLDRED
ncbi:MAG: bacterial transcriptional activator domain-containing protein [Chloroflexota bacterium]